MSFGPHLLLASLEGLVTAAVLALTALGLRSLSMRPASVGPVKALIRRVNLTEARAVIERARAEGAETARPALMEWLAAQPE